MPEIGQNIYRILQKVVDGHELSEQENDELTLWKNQSSERESLLEQLGQSETIRNAVVRLYNIDRNTEENLTKFLQQIKPVLPVHRVHFLKTAWLRYAAAVVILFGVGTYIYINNQKEKPSVTQTNPLPAKNDVAPGGNRATLTLADGSKIILDRAANGKIADQGTAVVEKKGEQVIYTSPVSRLPSFISYNTLSTPRGGQYQLMLPDGSQVWLNAESSITYPTAFSGSERKVSITGEAYFEVAKDKTKKFIVSIDGKQYVEVLGTHFNINAYKEEPTINTTLIEGKVKIFTRDAQNDVHTSLVLRPGQQGQLDQNTKNLSLAAHPDIIQVLAWKNGLFNLQGLTLAQAMRQFSRWYDVDIVYQGTLPELNFFGKIQRGLSLQQALKVLSGLGVDFKLEKDRRLIITKSSPK